MPAIAGAGIGENLVSHAEDHEGTRRDFLYYVAGGAGVVATGAAVWPLINQMNPSADVQALSSIRVDVSGVEPGTQLTVKWLCTDGVGFIPLKSVLTAWVLFLSRVY